eukprot:COSAG03_NODE_1975_length_3273_cov_8.984877_3_plen_81_part_00
MNGESRSHSIFETERQRDRERETETKTETERDRETERQRVSSSHSIFGTRYWLGVSAGYPPVCAETTAEHSLAEALPASC